MLCFTAVVQKFDRQGEKTGWTYIVVSEGRAARLNAGVRTSFRVKGKLDALAIEKTALLPMGDGSFILPLNAAVRKALKKQKGAEIAVCLEVDNEPVAVNADFLECLRDEPAALAFFQGLAAGHRNYFSKWIESAKTETTQAKRIATAVDALARGLGFPEMLRAAKKEKARRGL